MYLVLVDVNNMSQLGSEISIQFICFVWIVLFVSVLHVNIYDMIFEDEIYATCIYVK